MCAFARGFPSRVILPDTGASPAAVWQPATPRAIMPIARKRNAVLENTAECGHASEISSDRVFGRNCLIACRPEGFAVADRALSTEDGHIGVQLDGPNRTIAIAKIDNARMKAAPTILAIV